MPDGEEKAAGRDRDSQTQKNIWISLLGEAGCCEEEEKRGRLPNEDEARGDHYRD